MTLRPTLFGPEATKSSLYVVARDRHGNGKLSLCIQMNDCGKIIKTKFLYRDEESCQEQQCSICVHEENAEPQCLSKVPCVRAKNAEPQCLSRSVPCVMMMIPHTPEGASVCVGVCVSYPTVFDPCGLIQRTPLAFQGGNLPVLESRMCVCVCVCVRVHCLHLIDHRQWSFCSLEQVGDRLRWPSKMLPPRGDGHPPDPLWNSQPISNAWRYCYCQHGFPKPISIPLGSEELSKSSFAGLRNKNN